MISNFTTNIVCCKSKSKLVIQSWHHWMTIVNNKHEIGAFLFYTYWPYPIATHVSGGGSAQSPNADPLPLDAEPPWMQTYLLDADPSPWMHTTPWGRPPGCRPPSWMQADPLEADPPGGRPPLEADPLWIQTPWSCDLWCMLGSHPLIPVDRMTNACENITLPQTSFAGGKYSKILWMALEKETKNMIRSPPTSCQCFHTHKVKRQILLIFLQSPAISKRIKNSWWHRCSGFSSPFKDIKLCPLKSQLFSIFLIYNFLISGKKRSICQRKHLRV